MKTFDEYRQEAEIAINNLSSEVFYMGEFCASIEDVKKVLKIFQDLRTYIENEEYVLETELEYVQDTDISDCEV